MFIQAFILASISTLQVPVLGNAFWVDSPPGWCILSQTAIPGRGSPAGALE